MTNREAIEVFEKWKSCRDLVLAKNKVECDGSCDNCEFNIDGENTFDEAVEVAIEALKRELQNSCILDEEASNALMDIILKEDAKQASIPYQIERSKGKILPDYSDGLLYSITNGDNFIGTEGEEE